MAATAAPPLPVFDAARAGAFAALALANVGTEYPFHLVHYARSDADLGAPRALHPAFFGSYDWHSCVHMHWTLARCLGRFPQAPFATAVQAHFDARLTPAALAGECRYFEAPGRAGFERPYGWGWLLKLHGELQALAASLPAAARWRDALAPLAALLAQRLRDWLPRADYPVRAGTHGNSAFALDLALDWAAASGDAALAQAIGARARAWYLADRDYPAHYEPAGDDFLSGGLCEAVLMQRVLEPAAFAAWWPAFASAAALAHWQQPIAVSDARDPKIVHLHGLNLSRAQALRRLRAALAPAARAPLDAGIGALLARSLPAATAGDYVGTHWLASFALRALDDLG